MDNPHRQCENPEERNVFLKHKLQIPDYIDPQDTSILQKFLKQHRESKQQYQFLFEFAPDAIFIADIETGTILDANENAAKLLGIPVDRIIGMHQTQLHPPQEAQRYKKIFQEYIKKESGIISDGLFVHHKDGRNIPVQINAVVTQLGNNKVIYAIFRDMSRQKQLSEELKTVFESSLDCIVVVDKNYTNLYVNQAALHHVNITADKGIGKTIYDSLGHIPAMMNMWKNRIDEVFKTGKPMRVQDEGFIDERYVYSESVLSPICYPGGEMFAVSIVYRDMTEQKLFQKQFEENERKYRELYDNAHVALFRTALDGKLLYYNKACLTFFGYSPDDSKKNLINKINVTDRYVNPARRKEFIDTLMKRKCVRNFETELKKADGSTFWVSFSAEVFPEEGYIEGALYDITLEKVLTRAEQNVLALLMEGKSNKEIATQLARSIRTVEDHRSHIMQKLGVDNPFDLAKKALEHKNNLLEQ